MEETFSREFSPAVQNLLKRVYLILCCVLLASAFGAYLHILWNIGGLLTSFGFFGGMIWLRSTTPYEQPSKRLSLLLLSALFEGASVGPMIKLAFDVDISSFLVAASVGTAVPFACFAAAAMLVKRRDYLYLGGVLSSVISILWWLQFSFPIFGGFASIFMFKFSELHFGVLLFVGYIVVDTHKIIEKAHGGDMDYVKHALTFLTSFVAVLVRIHISSMVNNLEKKKCALRDV